MAVLSENSLGDWQWKDACLRSCKTYLILWYKKLLSKTNWVQNTGALGTNHYFSGGGMRNYPRQTIFFYPCSSANFFLPKHCVLSFVIFANNYLFRRFSLCKQFVSMSPPPPPPKKNIFFFFFFFVQTPFFFFFLRQFWCAFWESWGQYNALDNQVLCTHMVSWHKEIKKETTIKSNN